MLHIVINNKIRFWLPPGAQTRYPGFFEQIKKDMVIPNPAFEEAVKYDRSTRGIPRSIVLMEYDNSGLLTLPRGYAGWLLRYLKKYDIPYELNDNRVFLPPVSFGSRIVLRNYQAPAVEDLLNKGTQGILQAPAGSGKTQIGMEVIARVGQPALWLTHTRDLAQQAAERAAKVLDITPGEIGMLGAGRESVGQRLTIGVIQKLVLMDLSKLADKFGLVILDECFPAGTFIDNWPIESLEVGDAVTAWDDENKKLVTGKVNALFKRPVGPRLLRIKAGSNSVVCTPSHPVLTQNGWVPAILLSKYKDFVKCINQSYDGGNINVSLDAMSTLREYSSFQRSEIVMQDLPLVDIAGEQQNSNNLFRVRQTGDPYKDDQERPSEIRPLQTTGPSLLFRPLQGYVQAESQFSNNGSDQQEICIRAHEEKESHEQPGSSSQGKHYAKSYGMGTPCERRERTRLNCSPGNLIESSGLVYRNSGSNEDANEKRISNLLQDRYRRFESEDRNRSGRCFSPWQEGERPQERDATYWARVDDIEVLEPGSDGTFGGLCPDGYVYNFEVGEYHTYTANGFIVHNCHHSSCDSWSSVMNQLSSKYRYGVTATFERADGLEVITQAVIGPTLHIISRSAVEASGGVITPELRPVKTGCNSVIWERHEALVKRYKEHNLKPPIIPFGDILTEILGNSERNRLIVDNLVRECPGHSALVLSERVNHCEELLNLLGQRRPDIRAAVIHGKLSKTKRKNILAAMNVGELDVLFAVDIAKEGLDIPRLDRLFLVAGGRNEAEVEQKVGRIQRACAGKVDAVVFDFVDDKIGVLRAQHWARRKVYKNLGVRISPETRSA